MTLQVMAVILSLADNSRIFSLNMQMYTLPVFLLFASILVINMSTRAESPTESEILQLEEQIRRQETELEREKQRSEDEARRREEEKKLEEERARLEEERRKLEAERQAQEQKRQQEEEARRIAEEQQRAIEETEKRKQYEQYMEEADSAMNNVEFSTALDAYTHALKLLPDDQAALAGQTRAREYMEACNLFVGEWDWFLATVIANPDGTMKALALIPNQGKWECTDPAQRIFTLHWDVGGWVDTVTISEDGNKIDAINNIGMRFQAWRKGTKREKPVSKNPLYGN